MEIVYWVVIAIFVLALAFGIKDWVLFFWGSWHENGASFTVRAIVLFILIFAPTITRDYAPEYYNLAVMSLIAYSLGLLLLRFLSYGKHKQEES